jgi:hypothetical protein
MTTLTEVRKRLARLETRGGGDECAGRPTVILHWLEGQPEPTVPTDAQPCQRCGQHHVLMIRPVVVTTHEEALREITEATRLAGVQRQ